MNDEEVTRVIEETVRKVFSEEALDALENGIKMFVHAAFEFLS